MRTIVVALLALGALAAPASARAQSVVTLPRIAGPLPSIGLPLPRITAPLAPIGLDGAGRAAAPREHGPRGHRPGQARHAWPSIVYLVPGIPVGAHATYSVAKTPGYPGPHVEKRRGSRPPGAAQRESGVLRLNVEPAALVQVYVDGFFVGTPADYDHRLTLDAGEHRIELQAPGYRPASFAVRIEAGRSITYSTPLEPLAPPPLAAAPSPTAGIVDAGPSAVPRATTVYMIPGCYLGNVPPDQVRLPETCDTSKVTTYEP